jgi:hypothetical protein
MVTIGTLVLPLTSIDMEIFPQAPAFRKPRDVVGQYLAKLLGGRYSRLDGRVNYHLDSIIAMSDDKAGQHRGLAHLKNAKPSGVKKVSTSKNFHRHVLLTRSEASRRNMHNLVDGEQILDCPEQPNAVPVVIPAIV